MLVQQNEFEYEFEFYKRSSNFRKKNEFNIPSNSDVQNYKNQITVGIFILIG